MQRREPARPAILRGGSSAEAAGAGGASVGGTDIMLAETEPALIVSRRTCNQPHPILLHRRTHHQIAPRER
jgi:hypothetical protein